MKKPEEIKTLKALEEEFQEVYLIKDRHVIKVLMASVIANRMNFGNVWLMLVAASSAGKTEFIMSLTDIPFIHVISDLTGKTFASGFKRQGKEASLLLQIKNGILAFKDFTSLLSKQRDERKEILGQLREIYDGTYEKQTGTGDKIVWKGKMGAIAGATEVIYSYLEDFSAMGDRFIMYNIEQPDRIEATRRAIENVVSLDEKRTHLKQCVKFYLGHVISQLEKSNDMPILHPEMRDRMVQVADFVTKARSGLVTDFKTGLVTYAPKAEMPMRVTEQLYTLGKAFVAMKKAEPGMGNKYYNNGFLAEEDFEILYKVAFDSIPRTRRMVIVLLAKYRGGVSTAGVATALNLPTPSVHKFLSHINALGLCIRRKKDGNQGDHWEIREEYRKLMMDFEKIVPEEGELIAEEAEDEFDKQVREYEKEKIASENLIKEDVIPEDRLF